MYDLKVFGTSHVLAFNELEVVLVVRYEDKPDIYISFLEGDEAPIMGFSVDKNYVDQINILFGVE